MPGAESMSGEPFGLTNECPSCGYGMSPSAPHGKATSGSMHCPRCDYEGQGAVDWELADDLMQPGERGGGWKQPSRVASKAQFG